MGEIMRTPITVQLRDNAITIFDEDHTLSDIVRWLMSNKVDAEEVHRMLGEQLNATQS